MRITMMGGTGVMTLLLQFVLDSGLYGEDLREHIEGKACIGRGVGQDISLYDSLALLLWECFMIKEFMMSGDNEGVIDRCWSHDVGFGVATMKE